MALPKGEVNHRTMEIFAYQRGMQTQGNSVHAGANGGAGKGHSLIYVLLHYVF